MARTMPDRKNLKKRATQRVAPYVLVRSAHPAFFSQLVPHRPGSRCHQYLPSLDDAITGWKPPALPLPVLLPRPLPSYLSMQFSHTVPDRPGRTFSRRSPGIMAFCTRRAIVSDF